MTAEHKEKARKILNYYGETKQVRQLMEECAELIQAASKYERSFESSDTAAVNRAEHNFIAEVADVLIMIEQITSALFQEPEKTNIINDMIEYKLNRQLERIEKEERDRGKIV